MSVEALLLGLCAALFAVICAFVGVLWGVVVKRLDRIDEKASEQNGARDRVHTRIDELNANVQNWRAEQAQRFRTVENCKQIHETGREST